MAVLFRINLLEPEGIFSAETYNRLFSMHGIVMVFFFLVPSIPATLANFLIPIMIGAKDLAFPRINLLSWYIYVVGAIFTHVRGGSRRRGYRLDLLRAVQQHLFQLLCAGGRCRRFHVRLFVDSDRPELHRHRAQDACAGHDLVAAAAVRVVELRNGSDSGLGTPVLAITLLLLAFERIAHVGIFDPNIGGDPILFQHLFWFYSHPAVYIMILPGMGVISEIVACFSRKRVFGYNFVAFSSMAIAVLSFVVWGHHMFVTGESMYTSVAFSFLSFMVAVPSAIKVFNWTATMYKGSISFDTPMLYAFGFIGLFTIGGLTGLFLATLAIDVATHGTYFIVAHFHYVMVGGMVMAFLGGVHFWWPKITGRMYPEAWSKFAALIVFIGFNLTFFPQFILGYLGMPRRYHAYPPEFQAFNVLSTAGASILGIGYVIPMIYFIWSLKYGPKAGNNPGARRGWSGRSNRLQPHSISTRRRS